MILQGFAGAGVNPGRPLSARFVATVVSCIFGMARAWDKQLEQRIAALEASQKAWEYRGVWAANERYLRHNFVTHGGSVWVAIADQVRGKPGESADWQLAVKRGRDGRDGR